MPDTSSDYREFENPQRVTISGYNGDAMEPFITRDGRYLFFNNSNDPAVNTNLHYAERIDDGTFRYRGEVEGANSAALDGVATMDRAGSFYFVSTRSFATTLSTIHRGTFRDGALTGVELVAGISEKRPNRVIFDVEVSADGDALYLADGTFAGGPVPTAADIALAERRGDRFERSERSTDLFRNVNTRALEYAVAISADGLELFFTRLGTGPSIYRATRIAADQAFGSPERVSTIEGFVEAPSLSPNERSLYYHKREGDRFVIYRVQR